MEFINLVILFRPFCFFLVRFEADVLARMGNDKTAVTIDDVRGSVFDEVINDVSASSEAGKVGTLGGVDLETVRKIDIL